MKINLNRKVMTLKEIEKQGNRTLFFAVSVFIILVFLCSCGSRKSETKKETVKDQTEVKSTSETQTRENTTSVLIDTSTTDEIELIPIDNTKPIIYNGKEVHNAKIRHVKRKNGITTVSNKKVAQIKRNDVKTVGKREIKVKDKVSERESGIAWWVWILILGALYLAYRYLRRTNVI